MSEALTGAAGNAWHEAALHDAALAATRATGAWLLAQRERLGEVAVDVKAAGDLASAIDREAEARLRAALAPLCPGAGFHGEEGGGTALDAPWVWVVDPLDGSVNYLRGYPVWAVSVALLRAGEPVLGIVLDPVRGEAFHAQRGQGAWMDGRPLPRRRAAESAPFRGADPGALLHALAATVFPKPRGPAMPRYLDELARVLPAVGGLRRSGSMALELAHLAAGRLDCFWEHDMAPWDAAAALVLLAETGHVVTARDGAPPLHSRSLAVATPALNEAWLALLDGRPAGAAA